MKISREEAAHVAVLARLDLTDEQLDHYSMRMNDILVYMDKLAEVDTEGVEPTNNVTGMVNCFREDVVQPSLDHDAALANGPETDGRSFIVPKVI